MLWDMTISKSLGRYLQHGRVTGARKTQITISFTLAVTLAIEQVAKGQDSTTRNFLRRARARREFGAKQVKKVGITYFSFVFTIFFSLGCV